MVAGYWLVSAAISVIQNIAGLPIVHAFGLNNLMALLSGSISLIGGLGTAGAFGALFQDEYMVRGALSAGIACATFGMVAGSLIGGPFGEWIVKRHKIVTPNQQARLDKKNKYVSTTEDYQEVIGELSEGETPPEPVVEDEPMVTGPRLMRNLAWVFVAVGVGSTLTYYLKLVGVTLPPYLGAMFVAIIIRNIGDGTKVYKIDSKSVGMIGDITLALYITMAINSLQLVQLVHLAVPLLIILVIQILLMLILSYFLVFKLFGKDYDAAVMSSGLIGFGLGSTANALVCMQAITDKHGPSDKADFVVPIVGSFLADVTNAAIIAVMAGWLT
jgi:ESS family glutamate:Na+ symporter